MKMTLKRTMSWFMTLLIMLNFFAGTRFITADASEDKSGAWDGGLDFSWYDEHNRQSEYHISTCEQWAALAWICSEDLAYLQGDYTQTTNGNITAITGDIPTEQYNFQGVNIYLDADLDMGGVYHEDSGTWSGPNYYPIGGQYKNDGYTHAQNEDIFYALFYGSFNGQGHTVANIYCSRGWGNSENVGAGWYQSAGLFGRIGSPDGAEEPNTDIVIENVAVTGFIESSRSVGGIVGKTLHVADGYSVTVENCLNFATITNSDKKGVGGIIGSAYNGCYIINCANFGTVICGMQNGGGITGSSEATCISCYNVGDISESVYNHGQAYGTDNSGTVLTNFYYAVDSVLDAGSPAIYSAYKGQDEFDFTALSAEDMRTDMFKTLINKYSDTYGTWGRDAEKYDGYPVPEVFLGGDEPEPEEPEETYVITLSGDDYYSVKVNDSSFDYRSRSIFTIGSNESATLEITPDEDHDISEVSYKSETVGGASLTASSQKNVYVLSKVSGNTTITIKTVEGCTHNYVVTDSKEATCTEDGYITYECTKCGDKYTEVIPAHGHSYKTVVVPPTADSQGYTEYTCIHCGSSYVGNYTWLVSFDTEGGSQVDNIIADEGEPLERPADPVCDDGVSLFAGWYTDPECTELYDFSKAVAKSLTLYAAWSKTAYNVLFSADSAKALINGTAVPETVVRSEGAEVDFSVNPDTGYEVTEVSAAAVERSSIWDGVSIAEDFDGGAGTESSPYRIRTGEQLAYLAKQTAAGTNYADTYFILTGNIDLDGHDWQPIGTTYQNSFQGVFDGAGYTVSNLYINDESASFQGLFGYLFNLYNETCTTVKNLTVTGSVTAQNYSAGIAGYVYGSIVSNCVSYVTVKTVGSESGTGGVVGYAISMLLGTTSPAAIENCANRGQVTGAIQAGGIVGFASGASINGCLNYSEVTGGNAGAGGIAGSATANQQIALNINQCGNYGSVTAGGNTGGVVGTIAASGSISNNDAYISECFNKGSISTSGNYVGGIAGYVSTKDVGISDCYNMGGAEVMSSSASQCAGGILGCGAAIVKIENCYNTHNVTIGSTSGRKGTIAGYITALSLTWYNSESQENETTVYIKNNYWSCSYTRAWSYPSEREDANAKKITSAGTWLNDMAEKLGSAYCGDTELENGSYPMLNWEKLISDGSEKDENSPQLTDNGDESYTLSNIKSNIVVYIKTHKRIINVSFDTLGGSSIADINVEYGDTVSFPQEPVQQNYRFEGWYTTKECLDGTEFDPSEPVDEDFTLYAKWVLAYYKVSFVTYSSVSVIPDQQVDQSVGWKAAEPETPVNPGYEFKGWYNSFTLASKHEKGTEYDFSSIVSTDMKLYAGWTKKTLTVTIDSDNGGEAEVQNVLYLGYAERPAKDPEKDGYIFAGWYLAEDEELSGYYSFAASPVTKDITIRAKWVKSIETQFVTEPADADVEVMLNGVGQAAEDNGDYLLGEGLTYIYNVSAEGYTVQQAVLVPESETDETDKDENDENEDSVEEQSENSENTEIKVINVELEAVGEVELAFTGDADAAVDGENVSETNLLLGSSISFDLTPKDGKIMSGIKVESEQSESFSAPAETWDGTVDCDWAGEGTKDLPYLISTAEQLAGIAYRVNTLEDDLTGIYFKMTSDVDLEGRQWTPIGGNGSAYRCFEGIFDGDGHRIYNLYISSSKSYMGLFGYVSGADIKNVNQIKAYVTGESYIGGLAGCADSGSSISNCSISGTIISTHVYDDSQPSNYSRVGGIAGYISGSIKECENSAVVSAADGCCVGGIAGSAENAVSISDCTNLGNITGAVIIGGIIGYIRTDTQSVLTKLENSGAVSGQKAGGIVGSVYNTVISESCNCAEISGTGSVGGIVGTADASELKTSYNTGAVKESDAADVVSVLGGISGTLSSSGRISSCYSIGSITGTEDDDTGAVVGEQKLNTLISGTAFLSGAAPDAVGLLSSFVSGNTISEMKDYQLKYDSTIEMLGSAFSADYCCINDGFPVLQRQNTFSVTTDSDGVWHAELENVDSDTTITAVTSEVLYDVTWDSAAPYVITPCDGSSVPLKYGENFSFRVSLRAGYEISDGGYLNVMANSEILSPDADGVYTISNISENKNITVSNYEEGTYTVIFDPNGGTLTGVEKLRVRYPAKVSAPSDPVRGEKGEYSFIGWFTDANQTEKYDFSQPVSADITLYAGWYFDKGMCMVYDFNLPSGAHASGEYAGKTKLSVIEEQGGKLKSPPTEPECEYSSGLFTAKFLYWTDESGNRVDLNDYVVPQIDDEKVIEANKQALTFSQTTLCANWDVTKKNAESGAGEYDISSETQLLDIASAVSGGTLSSQGMTLVIQKDIDMTQSVSIGTDENPFLGTMTAEQPEDAGEETEQRYTITLASGQEGGLFGNIGESGTVEYINVNGSIVCSDGPTGLLANASSGTISCCDVSGSVIGHDQVGGTVGLNYGSISSVTAKVSITGDDYVGGIAGQSGTATVSETNPEPIIETDIEDCTVEEGSSINVEGDSVVGNMLEQYGWYVGGISGMSVGTIEQCVNHATFSYAYKTAPWCIGGISGVHYGGSVTECENFSDVAGTSYTAGIIGKLYPLSGMEVNKCVNHGDVTAAGYSSGGIVGGSLGEYPSYFRNCGNEGNVTSTVQQTHLTGFPGVDKLSWTGGIVGNADVGAEFSYCWNSGDIAAEAACVGGIAGYNKTGDLSYCFSTGKIDAVNAQGYVGGLEGYTEDGAVSNAYWYGSELYAADGAINVGYIDGTSECEIENVYYCNDAKTLVKPDVQEKATGESADSFKKGEVSYLIDFGAPDGSTSVRDKQWSLRDESKYEYASRYPTLGLPEYYMVTLTSGQNGTATVNGYNDVAYAGRTHTVTVAAMPSDETYQETNDNGTFTYHYEVDKVTVTYVLNSDGSDGNEACTERSVNQTHHSAVFEFTLARDGNYFVSVTFKAVGVKNDEEEPEKPILTYPGNFINEDTDDGAGNGNGSGTGTGDGNGDGTGQGNGSGNGIGDGDNGAGDTAGSGSGGRGAETAAANPVAPAANKSASSSENVFAAPKSDNDSVKQGDRSDTENNSSGKTGGSQEGGSGNNPKPAEPDVVPKVFEVKNNVVKTAKSAIVLIVLLMLAILLASALRRYLKYHRDQHNPKN